MPDCTLEALKAAYFSHADISLLSLLLNYLCLVCCSFVSHELWFHAFVFEQNKINASRELHVLRCLLLNVSHRFIKTNVEMLLHGLRACQGGSHFFCGTIAFRCGQTAWSPVA